MERETRGTTATVAAKFTDGHRVSWGAIFAGVALMVAVAWLLLLLGSAIGVGIADATDFSAMGDGLGIGSIIWILLSTIVATFAGGLLASKIAGIVDDRIGALHGLTVWAVGTILMVVLGASGIGGAMNSIGNALSTVNKATSSIVSSGGGEQSLIPDSVSTSIAAIIKRQASSVITETSGANGPEQSEVRSAIESLNAEDAGAISSALISGDTEKARNQLTQRTNLSDEEVNSIIQGAEEQAQNWGNSENGQQAQNWLRQQVESAQRSVSQSVSNMAGSQVSSQEVSQSLEELDKETMVSAGQYLIMGEPEMAKNVLAVNTSLSESDITAIVDGAEQEAQELISKAKAELDQASETVGTYTQAILWAAFIAAALGMVAGLVGGHMGAGAVRRVYPVNR